MKGTIIKNLNDFKYFCNDNYKQAVEINFKNTLAVILDSKFTEFKDLNNYLQRFSDFNKDPDINGELHRKFLSRLEFNIVLLIRSSEDFKAIIRYWNNWNKNDFKIKFCKTIFRFRMNFENQKDFSLITDFEKNYANKFKSNLRYAFSTYKLGNFLKNLTENGWQIYEVDEGGRDFEFSSLNNLLLASIKNYQNKIVIDIKHGDDWRIPTYVSSLLTERFWVICNGKIVYPNSIENFGALLPAVFVTRENLALLQQPLSIELWQKVKNQDFDDTSFDDYKVFKPFLKICQKYLFEEFRENESASYTKLRNDAYNSSEFAGYVNTIPLLALLIFAMYDNSYRSDLLSRAKEENYYAQTTLAEEDFLLEKQGSQDYRKFERYNINKQNIDVKNLLVHDSSFSEEVELHSTVISEIFECVSIAEGLLQILENAALHAGGGMLSMRIYSREKQLTKEKYKKPEHIRYLNEEYSSNYFKLDGVSGTSYFLEVQVSDLSDKSIPVKFIDNYTSETYIKEAKDNSIERKERLEIKELIEKYKEEIDLGFFFKYRPEQLEVKRKFFNLSNKNFVFHYGLEIFKTLVTARKGIFAVSGYTDKYENFKELNKGVEVKKKELEEILAASVPLTYSKFKKALQDEIDNTTASVIKKITCNKDISGTTYKMLLPLNHNSIKNTISSSSEIEIALDDKRIKEITNICTVKVHDMLEDLNIKIERENRNQKHKSDIELKRKTIENISNDLEKRYDGNQLLCLNFHNDKGIQHFEEVIKGCVLFVLNKLTKENLSDDSILPVALVNLTRFQLIEAARILSIFYSNNAIAGKDNLKKFQFYLKSSDSKGLIFAGNNLEEVTERLLKTAMANGAMNNDLAVVEQLLRRMMING